MGDGCGSGSWIESCASRRATARVPVTIVGLHCPGKRETGLHGPNRDCAMEPLAPRPEPPPAEKGDGCAGGFPSSHASSIIPSVLLCASVFQDPSLLDTQPRAVNTEAQR